MDQTLFSKPLTVLVGLGFPCHVGSLMDAIRVLDEQPSMTRDEAFHAAYDACKEALNNRKAADDARDVFCAFARRRGILIEEHWSDDFSGVSGQTALARN
jgi:hypothetical protein